MGGVLPYVAGLVLCFAEPGKLVVRVCTPSDNNGWESAAASSWRQA